MSLHVGARVARLLVSSHSLAAPRPVPADSQQQALEARISAALREKKQTHFLHQNNTGITQNLSYIGG